MNKKLFLLPFLTISLLVGCTNNKPAPAPSGSSSSEPAAKKIWELDEVEGESTIQQVKEGTAGQYYKVRGTVVANSGSTLAIYRKGQFLYCYNFKADATEKLKAHPLGSYVEIYAQSSSYSGSVQLTAYDVGTEKSTDKYDLAASLTVLENEGETVEPATVSTAEELANAPAAGKLMKFDFVPKRDFTFAADATDNQDLEGFIGETAFTIRLEKYLDADVKTALLAANPAQFAIGAKYSVVALGAATSSGNVRGLLVEGSSWVKTDDAHFAEPTAVEIDTEDGTTRQIVAGESLKLVFAVTPSNAKQAVVWSSSDNNIATVAADGDFGKVTAVAPGKVTITAKAADKETVKAELQLTVVAPTIKYTSIGSLSYNKDATVVIDNKLSDTTDPKITYTSTAGVSIVVKKGTSSSAVNVWKADYASCRWYVGHEVTISFNKDFQKIELTCDSSYDTFKDSATGDSVVAGATVSYREHVVVLEFASPVKTFTFSPDKQLRPSNVELFKIDA